ncbi:NAD(P)-dependent oxidoreductase [Actinospica durhamensis]|uniref:NAD(P)-dependent oxidoreductase n=1 Tax=Actinospica durhamensis TaxID=1508375 RepID=A0A941EV89_9ACTN|nr:NAD(P)-dependent oxidoreductase [Actinospica durhamensis]MBR7835659.1 NAD(P)-dependent oxidoreductase [Actinospica durhamensis]
MTTVAVLGTGLMGAGMARSLARAGLRVRVWNRTAQRARALAGDGIEAVEDPRAAVQGADVVVTMLFDADAVEQVMGPVLETLDPRAVWAQCATVGIEATEHLARVAESRGVAFVDAPVLGTRAPAENGQLIVVAGGPPAARERVAEVFDAIGSRTVWVGERPGDGHRLKLTLNAWVLSVTAATAQSVGLARRLGVEPRLFLETIAGGPTDCAYAQLKGAAMIAGDFAPSFTLAGATKDAALIERATSDAGGEARLMGALRGCFEAATRDAGDPAELDMAAVVRAFA